MDGEHHEVAQFRHNAIETILLLEEAGKPRRGYVRGNRFRINPFTRERHRLAIDIGGEDLQPDRRLRRRDFLEEKHRKGVGFFAGAATGDPNPQGAVSPVPAHEIGHDLPSE